MIVPYGKVINLENMAIFLKKYFIFILNKNSCKINQILFLKTNKK